VQQTAGSLRGLQAFFWFWAFSALKLFSRQALLTQAVGTLKKIDAKQELHAEHC